MKTHLKFLTAWVSATIIDGSIVFSISLLINYILIYYLYIEILKIFLWLIVFYNIFFYVRTGQTPGKYLVNLNLITIGGVKLSFRRVILREIALKVGLGFIIPFWGLSLFGYNDFYFNALFISACFIIFTIIFLVSRKQIWWNAITKTKIARISTSKCTKYWLYIALVLFWGGALLIIKSANNHVQKSSLNILGFNYPEKYIYPNNAKVKKYKEYLNKPHLSPKEYIFELFKKNNLVIICERFHPETTQWDLIYDIVSDKRFSDSIGNIFTEYGNQDKQNDVDKFLTTTYQNDSSRELAAANIMHNLVTAHPLWFNSPFFYFLTKLNIHNSTLPDSLKIREYFTNLPSWDFINNKQEYDSICNLNYDLVMATNVINQYHNVCNFNKRKKCLIITDYRHAFNNVTDINNHDEASYIYKAFPKTTVNVLLNSVAMKYPIGILWSPIEYGSWDQAFSLIGNKPLGFNFQDSPFGEVEFETNQHFPLGSRHKSNYNDVFTGYIFINPIEDFRVQDFYPYIMNNFENEYRRRYSIKFKDTTFLTNSINKFKILGKNPKKNIFEIIYFQNCVEILVFIILTLFAFLISTFYILALIASKNKK